MPNQVYSFSLRSNIGGGAVRCSDKAEAESLYNKLAEELASGKEFIELRIHEEVATIRAKDISSFSISVTFEETPEERKARAIARIESGAVEDFAYATNAIGSGSISGKLF